jgi:hypothetical protein
LTRIWSGASSFDSALVSASRAQVGDRQADQADRREQLELEVVLPGGVGDRGEGGGGRGAGVVDEDVEPAVAGDDGVDQAGDVVGAADVGRHRGDLRACLCGQLARGPGEHVGPPGAHDHLRALAGERPGGGPADALAAAGDERDPVVKVEVHGGGVAQFVAGVRAAAHPRAGPRG